MYGFHGMFYLPMQLQILSNHDYKHQLIIENVVRPRDDFKFMYKVIIKNKKFLLSHLVHYNSIKGCYHIYFEVFLLS